jgi:hypothetical protein
MKKATFCLTALVLLLCAASFGEDKTKSVEFGEEKHTMNIPEKWEATKPENPGMRLMQIKVPKSGDDKEDAEVLIFFIKAGGSVDDNIKRWSRQFGGGEAKKTEAKTASGKTVTVAEIDGTYTGMGANGQPMPARENYKLFGTIIPDDGIFIKLTGPKATVAANKEAFDKMLASYK